jgi:hypothetical protein
MEIIMPFKVDFTSKVNRKPYKGRRKTKPSYSNIKVKEKFKKMAMESFGILPNNTEQGHYSKPFVNHFPLALQITHDNYMKFSHWLRDHKEYGSLYAIYNCDPIEFTYTWWKELGWGVFLQDKYRQLDSLFFAFDLKKDKSIKWVYWWCNEHNFFPGTARRLIKEFQSNYNN